MSKLDEVADAYEVLLAKAISERDGAFVERDEALEKVRVLRNKLEAVAHFCELNLVNPNIESMRTSAFLETIAKEIKDALAATAEGSDE